MALLYYINVLNYIHLTIIIACANKGIFPKIIRLLKISPIYFINKITNLLLNQWHKQFWMSALLHTVVPKF